MANRKYERGRRFEWQLKKEWEDKGYVVTRASGSHGCFDLVALRADGQVDLIQCKTTKNEKEIIRLQKEFKNTLPFPKPPSHYKQMLVVKILKKKGYITYIPECV